MVNKNEFDGGLRSGGKFSAQVGYAQLASAISGAAVQFLDPVTQEVRADLAVERSCPACGASNSIPVFKKNGFIHRTCADCAMLFVSPCLNSAALTAYYTMQSNEWTDVVSNPEFRERQSLYFSFHLENFARYAPPRTRTLLDIGCNSGDFMAAARDIGYSVTGLEFNERAVAVARGRGLNVTTMLLLLVGILNIPLGL